MAQAVKLIQEIIPMVKLAQALLQVEEELPLEILAEWIHHPNPILQTIKPKAAMAPMER